MSRKGSRFEYEISSSLKQLEDVFYYKFPNRKYAVHPFDTLVITPDQDYGIELKSTQDPSWRIEDLREKQKKSLLWFQKMRGNTSLVMLNYRRGRGEIHTYAMTIEEILKIIEEVKEDLDRKSIPRDHLEGKDRVRKLERIEIDGKYGWDLSFLLA